MAHYIFLCVLCLEEQCVHLHLLNQEIPRILAWWKSDMQILVAQHQHYTSVHLALFHDIHHYTNMSNDTKGCHNHVLFL